MKSGEQTCPAVLCCFFFRCFSSISFIYFVMPFVTIHEIFVLIFVVNTLEIAPCLELAVRDSDSVQPGHPFVIPLLIV